MTILRFGSKGPEVELLQLGLRRAGIYGPDPDGSFGPATQKAVSEFQRRSGLSADGIAGPRTWQALMPYLTGSRTVTVVSGDSLSRLALRYGSSIKAIETANPSADPFNLQIGSRLVIPLPFPVVPTNISFTSQVLELCAAGLKARYPFIETGSIGSSVLGKNLFYFKIGEGKSEAFYNAAHHANEWITSPLLMKYLENYAAAFAFGSSVSGKSAPAVRRSKPIYSPDCQSGRR